MERYELASTLAEGETFSKDIKAKSGVEVSSCYQCGKCSAGCPLAFAMDYMPRQIIRMVQLGIKEEVLKAKTIWLCVGCDTCYTRCPRKVDLPKLMEALRIEAKKAGFIGDKNVNLFADLFLKSVEQNGRVHEMGMILQYNIFSGQLLTDAMKSPKLFFDGKISPLPSKSDNKAAIKQIFAKVRRHGGA